VPPKVRKKSCEWGGAGGDVSEVIGELYFAFPGQTDN
jgi:hypothetical protein